jgi:cell division topological specificity factor
MFDIMEFINRIFKKDSKNGSGEEAKERLKLVLISDRATISPHVMESLKEELIQVISRYMTIDTSMVEMGLERKGKEMALAANIPILGMKRSNRKETGDNGSPAPFKPEPAKPAVKSALSEAPKAVPKVEKPVKQPVVKTEAVEEEEERPAIVRSAPVKNEPVPPVVEQSSDEDETDDDSASSRKGKKAGRRYLARTAASGGRRTSSSRRRS